MYMDTYKCSYIIEVGTLFIRRVTTSLVRVVSLPWILDINTRNEIFFLSQHEGVPDFSTSCRYISHLRFCVPLHMGM